MNIFETGDDRTIELRLKIIEILSEMPRDVELDLDLIRDQYGWNGCRDGDRLSAIFRKWRESANNKQTALLLDINRILRIDAKGGDLSEEDKHRRSSFIDNIESIVGKGRGEEYLVLDPESRWDMLLDYLREKKTFPRERRSFKDNVYVTVGYDGHIELQRKSVNRAHNQLFNQNGKNIECFLSLPSRLSESQLIILLGKCKEQKDIAREDLLLQDVYENAILKRLEAVRSGDERFKKLMAPDEDINVSKSDLIDLNELVMKKRMK